MPLQRPGYRACLGLSSARPALSSCRPRCGTLWPSPCRPQPQPLISPRAGHPPQPEPRASPGTGPPAAVCCPLSLAATSRLSCRGLTPPQDHPCAGAHAPAGRLRPPAQSLPAIASAPAPRPALALRPRLGTRCSTRTATLPARGVGRSRLATLVQPPPPTRWRVSPSALPSGDGPYRPTAQADPCRQRPRPLPRLAPAATSACAPGSPKPPPPWSPKHRQCPATPSLAPFAPPPTPPASP